jgi:hypothetical protein
MGVIVSPSVATREYPSPSRSASGQLNANTGNRGRLPAPNEAPSLFATRPLPESPAAAYARSTEQLPTYAARPPEQAPGYNPRATEQVPSYNPRATEQMPAYNPRMSENLPAQTAGYGQVPYATSPPVPGAAAKAKSTKAREMARQTAQVPVQTANWQSALPVSPWSTYERQAGPVTGLETETILRSDLRSLKRSRLRARIYLAAVVLMALGAGHFGLKVLEQNASRARTLEQANRALKAQLAGGGVDLAQPGRANARGAAPVSAAAASSETRALAEELKRQLVGDEAINVEARGDRVVVSMDDASLFDRNGTDVGQAGFRVLYRFGKALKNVPDRHIVVSVIANEGVRNRPWITAAARGISLGRFLLDDLSVEANRVHVMTPAPRQQGRGATKTDRIEFSLERAGAVRS